MFLKVLDTSQDNIFSRRDEIKRIEEKSQKKWEAEKVFEVDAPPEGVSLL